MKFKENIIYVLKDKNISIKDFCKSINVGKNLIYDLDKHLPTTINAITANIILSFLEFFIYYHIPP